MIKKKNSGFTLIELLVVISIIGILMGIVGPKVFDLLSSSKATKTQAVFRSWVTQLYQYQQFYKYFLIFLDDKQEGSPMIYRKTNITILYSCNAGCLGMSILDVGRLDR